ncbi:succinate dehydrogenase, hydrophobic membrane anchor protein [Thiosocius teredinicola]|uniref:succinate dehydrogenase, hydrophobic membrane anchor protein n=1 Tax=Thiosocius teredinicola TaxID=1973002 RepID=UPI000990D157
MSRKASGLKAWAIQRLTAIYIGLFALYLLLMFLFSAPASYFEWKAWMGGPFVSIATLLFVVSVLMHAWIGIRDVLIDYVHPIAIRAGLLGAVALFLVAMGLWAAQALILVRLA